MWPFESVSGGSDGIGFDRSSDSAGFADFAGAYRRVDWSASGLGEPTSWSPTLATALRMMLGTRMPAVLFWGPSRVYLYNEATAAILGGLHPAALGVPAADVFPEAWQQLAPLVDGVLSGGPATWLENAPTPLMRRGVVEEAYFSYSYSPVTETDGSVVGVFGVAIETTRQVIAQRRLELLNSLSEVASGTQSLAMLRVGVLGLLATHLPGVEVVELHVPHPQSEPSTSGGRRDTTQAATTSARGRFDDTWVATPAARREDRAPGGPVAGFGGGVVAWAPGHDGRVPSSVVALSQAVTAPELSRRTVLVVRADDAIVSDGELQDFLQMVADAVATAAIRVLALQGERMTAASDRAMSLELQNSMLSPPHTDRTMTGTRLATRYVPAASREEVGGDWYDALTLPDGPLVVTIGDVAGHDGRAAAAMGQLRSLARGILLASAATGTPATSTGRSRDGSGAGPGLPPLGGEVRGPGPARTTELLDRAIADFAIDTVATFLMAEIAATPATGAAPRPLAGEGAADVAGVGGYAVRWANAGHVPPLLIGPDGTARLLDDAGQMILGIDPDVVRSDLRTTAEAGSTLLLYTDGLIERRGEILDVGLARLVRAAEEAGALTPDDLCDHVLATLGPFDDDDVAIMALRLD